MHLAGRAMTFLRIVIALYLVSSMIFSESRYPPIGSRPEGMLFRIMPYR